MIEMIGAIATTIAIAGVLLNNYRRRSCFLLWIFSNTFTLIIHAYIGVWSLAARDVVFLVLAVHGLYAWKPKP